MQSRLKTMKDTIKIDEMLETQILIKETIKERLTLHNLKLALIDTKN